MNVDVADRECDLTINTWYLTSKARCGINKHMGRKPTFISDWLRKRPGERLVNMACSPNGNMYIYNTYDTYKIFIYM